MFHPTTKQQLIDEILDQREKLGQFISGVPLEKLELSGVVGTWSVKDVLAHLAEWHQLLLGWYEAGLRGETPSMPVPGFKWSQMSKLNQQIYEKFRQRSFQDITNYYNETYRQVMVRLETLDDDALFIPGRFAWTGKNSLAGFIIPCTSHHYHWARTAMKKGLKRL